MNLAQDEISSGKRFAFGENWTRFLSVLNEERIASAQKSLCDLLGVTSLQGKSFLDIGCGSGLFSLCARRLGASVRSFDFDRNCVECAKELKNRNFTNDSDWVISEGSILDRDFIESLGHFDFVYSWGVLHHTGAMWKALEHSSLAVTKGGCLAIAIYNDQGILSKMWLSVKEMYCSGPLGRYVVSALFIPGIAAANCLRDLLNSVDPTARYRGTNNRGMSSVYDWFDWLGGLPFEVAKTEELFHFFKKRGFQLENLITERGHGNNQLVFSKT